MSNEGELKKRIREQVFFDRAETTQASFSSRVKSLEQFDDILDEVRKEFPKVSQKWVPTKGKRVDWKRLCLQMEQKIIEFENFGKKWFGDKE